MTPRERRKALQQGKRVDHLPIMQLHPDYAAKLAGYGIAESHFSAEKSAQREINMYETYHLDMVMVTYFAMKLQSGHLLKSLAGVEALDVSMYTYERDLLQRINYEAIERIQEAIGEDIAVTYGVSGPLTLAGGLVPHTAILRGMRKNKEGVHRLLRLTTDFLKAMADRFASVGDIHYMIFEPVASGSLLSPKQFEEFAFPYLEEIISYLKGKSEEVNLHICGNTTKSLPLIAQTGADFFSLDQEVDIAEAVDLVGGQIGLMGNVDPTTRYLQGTPEEMRQAVKACFAAGRKSERGFRICSGCGVPYATPEENMTAYIEAACEFGQG